MIHLKKLAFSFVNLNIILRWLSEKDKLVGKWIKSKGEDFTCRKKQQYHIKYKK